MVNKTTIGKMLETLDDDGCIDFAYLTGNYEFSLQREKVFEVLYSRCFSTKEDYNLSAAPGLLSVQGNGIPDDDLFGEYIGRYLSVDVKFDNNIYCKVLRHLEKYGKLCQAGIWNDDIIDLASREDVTLSEECEAQIRSMDLVQETLPLTADVEGLKKAFPYLQQQLADWFCYDPLNEAGTLELLTYESDVIGKLFGFDTDDEELLHLRELLSRRFLGFDSIVSDGKFYMYVVFGTIDDQFATIEDLPDNFIAQVAMLEQCIERYVTDRPQVELHKEDDVCRAA